LPVRQSPRSVDRTDGELNGSPEVMEWFGFGNVVFHFFDIAKINGIV
jgi:hypothetical protein